MFTFVVELTVAERVVLSTHCDPHEYDVTRGLQEFNRERCVQEHVHPAIIDLYDAIFPLHS